MDIKHKIKRKLQDYYLGRLKSFEVFKGLKFDFHPEKKTALLFYINGKADLDLVRSVVKVARKKNKNTFPVIYSSSEKNVDIITDRDFHIFNSNDFDYRWKPKQELKKWLEKTKVDLLINFCFGGQAETTLFYTMLQANFRVSNQNPGTCEYSDLTINTKEKQTNLVTFYNLAIDNLKMLNIRRN